MAIGGINQTDLSEISLLAIIICFVAIVVIGIIWFRPAVFYERWLEGIGITEEDIPPTPMLYILWASNVFFGVILSPSCCLAFASVFLVDARSVPTLIIGLGLISGMSLPIVIILTLVLSRFLYRKQLYVLAVLVSLAPLLNLGGIFLADALMRPYLR